MLKLACPTMDCSALLSSYPNLQNWIPISVSESVVWGRFGVIFYHTALKGPLIWEQQRLKGEFKTEQSTETYPTKMESKNLGTLGSCSFHPLHM